MLLASDYDETIRKGGISDEDLASIADFRERGNCFCIATGRCVNMIINELAHFGLEVDYLIGNNGGFIATGGGEIIFREDIDYSAAMDFIEYYGSRYKNSSLGTSNGIKYARIQEGVGKPTPAPLSAAAKNAIINPVTSTLEEVLEQGRINSFFFKDTQGTATAEMTEALRGRYGDAMNFHFNSTVDVSSSKVDKAVGVGLLADHLCQSRVYVVGNSYNDVPMFNSFTSACIDASEEEVKQHADYRVSSVSEWIELLYHL